MSGEVITDLYHDLRDAVAEVGRIIEELPPHARREQLIRVLDERTHDEQLDIMLGTFVVAHDIQHDLGPSRSWLWGEENEDT